MFPIFNSHNASLQNTPVAVPVVLREAYYDLALCYPYTVWWFTVIHMYLVHANGFRPHDVRERFICLLRRSGGMCSNKECSAVCEIKFLCVLDLFNNTICGTRSTRDRSVYVTQGYGETYFARVETGVGGC